MPKSRLLCSSSGTAGWLVMVTPGYNPTPLQLMGHEDMGKGPWESDLLRATRQRRSTGTWAEEAPRCPSPPVLPTCPSGFFSVPPLPTTSRTHPLLHREDLEKKQDAVMGSHGHSHLMGGMGSTTTPSPCVPKHHQPPASIRTW